MFGYLPMYNDLVSLWQSARMYRERVAKLLADEGKEKVVHFEHSLSDRYEDADQYRDQAIDFGCNGSFRFHRNIRYVNPMFRATIRYSYELPDWAKEDANLRGLLDMLGVQVNPRVIWAAIPFSFVIDWVIGIGRWLDQFKTSNLEPRTHIHRYCISVTVKRSVINTIQVIGDNVTGCNTGEVPVTTWLEEAYYRTPLTPPWLRSLRASGLSSTEFSLGSALVLTRR